MNFDVAIGNPPYSRGSDLDFTYLTSTICNYACMITPAKWQTCPDVYHNCKSKTIDYKTFREKVVKHMKKVVYYTDSKDVFDIYQVDGITYYLVDTHADYTNNCQVFNKSITRKEINSEFIRDITQKQTLWNIALPIIKDFSAYDNIEKSGWSRLQLCFWGKSQSNEKYKVYTNKHISGYDWFNEKSPRYCLASSVIIQEGEENTLTGEKLNTFQSNELFECKSFVSYINTRLIRFLISIYLNMESNVINPETFRYIPIPKNSTLLNIKYNPWNEIYTDERVYEIFNISKENRKIVEALIKERSIIK